MIEEFSVSATMDSIFGKAANSVILVPPFSLKTCAMPFTNTSGSGCCLGRLPAQLTLESLEPSQTPKSMALSVVDLAEMEGGKRAIGLLIIDSSCTHQSFSRQLAYSPVSYFN